MKLLIIMTLLLLMPISYANEDEISLEQASESIRKESKGQVLSATTKNYKGVKTHRIQVLTESGRVKVYQVPANKQQQPKPRQPQQNDSRYNRPNNSNDSNNYRNINPNNNSTNRKETKKQKFRTRPQNNRNINNQDNESRDRVSKLERPTKPKRDR
jgi:hypothetical protein